MKEKHKRFLKEPVAVALEFYSCK